MRRLAWVFLVTIGFSLACAGDEVVDEVPTDEAPAEDPDDGVVEPNDTGVLPPEPSPRERKPRGGGGGGRERRNEPAPAPAPGGGGGGKGGGGGGGKSGTLSRCLTATGGDVTADLSLDFEGTTVVGGRLSWTDVKKGTAGIAEPLKGKRDRSGMTASGPATVAGKSSGQVEVHVTKSDQGMSMTVDGSPTGGKVRQVPCR